MGSAAAELRELDLLSVTVVVDNVTDMLSQPCEGCDGRATKAACHYTSEANKIVADIHAGRAEEIDFRKVCYAGHGLSLYIVAESEGQTRTLLFDSGPNGPLWQQNMGSLGLSPENIDAVVLSHWHVDHSNGLPHVAAAISKGRAQPSSSSSAGSSSSPVRPNCIIDLHPKHPFRRGLMLSADNIIPFNTEPALDDMAAAGVQVELHDQEHLLLDNSFYVSGFIPRVTDYEEGNPLHGTQWEKNGEWVLDSELEDERFLMVKVKGRGPIVFSACSHAGIVNVVKAATAAAGQPPHCIMGGFHLSPRDCVPRIAPTVRDLKSLAPDIVVLPGHCTGWRAQQALKLAFPHTCMPTSVGGTYDFKPPT